MKVSVIIPVYNASRFLDRSIFSALSQNQTGEVLLIDDRSTDNSLEICQKWAQSNPQVHVYINDGIKGAGAARNVGLKIASCEYVAFLDADDYYLEGRFDEAERLFKKYTDIEVVAGSVMISEDENISYKTSSDWSDSFKLIGYKASKSKIDMATFFKGNSIHISGITARRTLFEKVGSFDEALKQGQDVNMLYRMMSHTNNILSGTYEAPVAVYQLHDNNTTKNATEVAYYRRKLAKKHFGMSLKLKHPLALTIKFFKDFVEYDYLWIFGRHGRFKKVKKLLMMPIFCYRLFSKKDPEYNPYQKVDLS